MICSFHKRQGEEKAAPFPKGGRAKNMGGAVSPDGLSIQADGAALRFYGKTQTGGKQYNHTGTPKAKAKALKPNGFKAFCWSG